jgi:hypothetical protein
MLLAIGLFLMLVSLLSACLTGVLIGVDGNRWTVCLLAGISLVFNTFGIYLIRIW